MFKLEFDDATIDKFAEKIADRAYEKLREKLDTSKELPPLLTRSEAMNVLRVGETKMAELMARPDFPVNREFGVKIPAHLLLKWVDLNTQWVETNTSYFRREVI